MYPGAPAKLLGSEWAIRRRAPLLGEHTDTILRDELGLSRDELAALAGAEIIA
jgi:crotonobetainyl-CoA:carnitine CoA-transferase CaiB-like acyl-CoA transferase